MVADRGYDADKTLTYIEGHRHATATIPPRESRVVPRECDYAAYKERHLVDRILAQSRLCASRTAHFSRCAILDARLQRWAETLVECFIGKLKHFRRIFSRFDKYARRFLAFIHFACTFIWLK